MNQLQQVEERRRVADLERRQARRRQEQQLLLLRHQLMARWIRRVKGVELELTDREVGRMVAWVAMRMQGLEQEMAKE